MRILYPGQAVDRLLETIDLSSVFLASLMRKSFPFLPSYVLPPAFGMRESGVANLILRFASTAASVSIGFLGAYLIGTWIGIRWFSQFDDHKASAAEGTDTAKEPLTFEADQ